VAPDPAGEYTFFYGKGNESHELDTGLFKHKRIISAAKSVEFVSDRCIRESYQQQRGFSLLVIGCHT
jgi:hypothetical protein